MDVASASVIARGGVPVRRAAWAGDPTRSGAVVVFVAGAGSTRAVAVVRRAGAETIVGAEFWRAAEALADDWEVA